MPSYLVDGYLPRSRAGELAELIARLRAAAEALTLFLHLMEAESAEAAGEASRRVGIAPERIVEAR